MTNNSVGFFSWEDIVGNRLLPVFPSFGGQIKDGILYARIPPKFLTATMFGESKGIETERVKNLAKLFKTAKISYAINKDMRAYLITHSISDIALLGGLYY